MVEESDDDKPVLAAVMKMNSAKSDEDKKDLVVPLEPIVKQEKNALLKKIREEANGTTKASSSSSKPSRDSSSKTSPTVKKSKPAPKPTIKLEEVSDDDLPISSLMKKRTSIPVAVARPVKKAKVEEPQPPKKSNNVAPVKVAAIPPGIGAEFYQTKKGATMLQLWWLFLTMTGLEMEPEALNDN